MRSRALMNLALLALVLMLVLVVIYDPGGGPPETALPLTALKPGQIHFIRISDRRGREIVLEKEGREWRMIRPRETAANRDKIEQLLGIAATPRHARFPLPAARLAEFGLAPPAIRLQLNETVLEFGATDPLQHRRYVRTGDELNLISDGFQHHLLASPEAYMQSPTDTGAR